MTRPFFDAALLITTFSDERFIQRKCRHIERHLFLPEGFVQVIQSVRDSEDTKRGCFNAHFNVYQMITLRGFERTLIFEDDVHFLRSIREEEYREFLETHEWDVFYFGHKPDHRQDTHAWSTWRKHIVKVRTNDRHAYAMTLDFAKRMADQPWSGVFGDRLLRSSSESAYALYPMGAIQSGPLFTASFYNGITEKFNEYYALIKQRPFQLWRTLTFALRFVVIMPYAFVRSVILAIGVNSDYPK